MCGDRATLRPACSLRARDPLAAPVAHDPLATVRHALAQVRDVLAHGDGGARDRDRIVLAASDIARALVDARRSKHTLPADLADVEADVRDLLARAACVGGRR